MCSTGSLLINNCNLSHILFTDDILLFIEDEDFYIKNMQMALNLFEKASGLNINHAKSMISPVNVSTIRLNLWLPIRVSLSNNFQWLIYVFLLVGSLGPKLFGKILRKKIH